MKKLGIIFATVIMIMIFAVSASANNEFFDGVFRKELDIRPEVTFFDYKGNYNVVQSGYYDYKATIDRYDANLTYLDTVTITSDYPWFGDITFDEYSNYYICWGCPDMWKDNRIVISIAKYDYYGKFLAECTFTGYDTAPDTGWITAFDWGTQYPFSSGECSMAINENILCCNFARQMYNGHQASSAIYIDIENMTELSGYAPYCSHSFDGDVLALSDGGFLVVNHGDAHPRGYQMTKISSNLYGYLQKTIFNFREGQNIPYGYNKTFAEFGGICETNNAYILCASSERTLSLDAATSSFNEPRDLFLQFIKKDMSGFIVEGETRIPIGERPQNLSGEFFLNDQIKNEGVVWLTSYQDNYYVHNPKIVALDGEKILIMWEKRNYFQQDELISYYKIIDENGNIIKDDTAIGEIPLNGYDDVVLNKNNVYWINETVLDDGISSYYINVLNISDYTPDIIKLSKTKYTYDGKAKEPAVLVEDENGYGFIEGIDYKVTYESSRKNPGKHTVIVTFIGDYVGEKELEFSILPGKTSKITATQSTSAIKLTWKKVTGADGYRVYQYNSKTGKYEKIKTLTGTSYTVKKLKAGTSYKFAVKAYTKDNGETLWAASSVSMKTATKPATPTVKATAGSKQATISWNKITGATGYVVYMQDEFGDYEKLGSTKKTSYTRKKLTKGETYYFRVRAYKTVDGKNIYGGYKTVKVKVK
ncbi:MAG: fibronectin type III domain-containing protein [Clostridia bacterium]|nr:fibronectin type III domain-containing protein [Clostridia bacterium]